MKDEELGVDLAGSHILVVDDNPKNLQVIGNILKKHNFHLHFVLSGTKVFDALAQTEVDLILMVSPLLHLYYTRQLYDKHRKTY